MTDAFLAIVGIFMTGWFTDFDLSNQVDLTFLIQQIRILKIYSIVQVFHQFLCICYHFLCILQRFLI